MLHALSRRAALVATLLLAAALPGQCERSSSPAACAPLASISMSAPPPFETHSYRFPSGAVELGGCLYRPKGLERFPVVVLVAGSDDLPSAAQIYFVIHAKAFAVKGIGVFSFDKRGLGDSAGMPTGTDFVQRAADVAAALRFVRSLPETTHLGVWGVSQAGWVVPQALHAGDGVELVELVSAAGVSPNDQVAFFIHRLMRQRGLTHEEAAQAEAVHRAVVRYYASGKGYATAQALVDRVRSASWFERFRGNDQWDEKIAAGGRLLDPSQLAAAWRSRPHDFDFYRAPSTFEDFLPIYTAGLDRPTLIVHGSADSVVPVDASSALFAAAFRANHNADGEIQAFDGASHGIQDGPHVRPAYLDFLADWAARRFATAAGSGGRPR